MDVAILKCTCTVYKGCSGSSPHTQQREKNRSITVVKLVQKREMTYFYWLALISLLLCAGNHILVLVLFSIQRE